MATDATENEIKEGDYVFVTVVRFASIHPYFGRVTKSLPNNKVQLVKSSRTGYDIGLTTLQYSDTRMIVVYPQQVPLKTRESLDKQYLERVK